MITALDNQNEYEDAFNPGNYDEWRNYQQSRPQNWLSVSIHSSKSNSAMTRLQNRPQPFTQYLSTVERLTPSWRTTTIFACPSATKMARARWTLPAFIWIGQVAGKSLT